MSLLRSFIVSCRIGLQARQFSSSVTGEPSDKKINRLPPGYGPVNAYALYCQEFLKEKKEESVLLAISAAAKKWKSLDQNAKESYIQKSKAIAEERKAAFENLPASKKEELRRTQLKILNRRKRMKRLHILREKAEKSGRPKAPPNAYAIYIMDFYAQNKNSSNPSDSKQSMTDAAMKWNEMSDTEKKKYKKRTVPAKKEYEKAMSVWKAEQDEIKAKEMEACKKQRKKGKVKSAKKSATKTGVFKDENATETTTEDKISMKPRVVKPNKN